MVTMSGIRDAWAALRGVTHITPLITSRTLDHLAGARVFLKAENFQRTGSFKLRGAYNLLRLGDFSRGVVTASSGNHGAALAYAAGRLGIAARVVMPVDAPAAKVAAARSYGAEVELYGKTSPERQQRAQELADRQGLGYAHSYDDPRIIAGQGTVALEVLDQLPDVDMMVVPVGGGGLISGVAVCCKESTPRVRVTGVEPSGADRMTRSLQAGRCREVPHVNTLADGLRVKLPGELTFEYVRRLVDQVVTVTDEEILCAMRFLFERCKLVVEPSGAAALAAVLSGKVAPGQKVAVVLSGGNVELGRLGELFSA
ncbi:MAG: threonine/serine dehydratase [Bacillota bacterium]